MANLPLFKADIDIPADVFREAKEAGPNARGMYTLQASFWNNDRRQSDRHPNFTGQVQVKGKQNGSKGYCSMWDNRDSGSSGGSKSFNEDPF